MSEFQHKRSESKESSAVSATVRARDMLCELSGPRGWNDTRESWLARGARRAGLTIRRARAIFYSEPIRLTADEYLAIQTTFDQLAQRIAAADVALAPVPDLARPAADEAGGQTVQRSAAPQGKGGAADRPQR